uniref:Uncharacterized protein n=1 Tax=Glossina palpalis gambiensis TaxID=67801 RepID=A0A1B0BQZ7_9MUSC
MPQVIHRINSFNFRNRDSTRDLPRSAKIGSYDTFRDFSTVEVRSSKIDCKQLLNLINNLSNHHFVISSIAFMAVIHLHLCKFIQFPSCVDLAQVFSILHIPLSRLPDGETNRHTELNRIIILHNTYGEHIYLPFMVGIKRQKYLPMRFKASPFVGLCLLYCLPLCFPSKGIIALSITCDIAGAAFAIAKVSNGISNIDN